MKSKQIHELVLWALFVAIIAATAFISIPTPFGINFTMQIFGCCLAGLCLGVKGGFAATVTYILLGALGLPIFSAFTGGLGVLTGPSGGFIWGFIFVTVICGIAAKQSKKSIKTALCISAVLICHAIGVIQYAFVSGIGVIAAIVTVSIPFILKDFVVVLLSLLTAKKLKRVLK